MKPDRSQWKTVAAVAVGGGAIGVLAAVLLVRTRAADEPSTHFFSDERNAVSPASAPKPASRSYIRRRITR